MAAFRRPAFLVPVRNVFNAHSLDIAEYVTGTAIVPHGKYEGAVETNGAERKVS